MTIEEFTNTRWGKGMSARYHGNGITYPVTAVEFDESLIALDKGADTFWVRCENVTLYVAITSEPK